MIIGIGVDIVEVDRIRRLLEDQGSRFKNRVFTLGEQQKALEAPHPENTYAKRFAAKEAFVKALQTHQDGISWTDIEVINTPSGAPDFKLTGRALETLKRLNPKARAFLSLSDTKNLAQAMVIISVES